MLQRAGARAVFASIASLLILSRLCHSGILWADDDLPLAAAIQMAMGKALYRDVWFDKPPLVAGIYLLWGAQAGWMLRLAGAMYVLLVAWLGYRFAREKWGESEGLIAAVFLAFFLTFGLPSAVMPLAADLLLVAPHLAAVWFAWRGRPFCSGAAAGLGLLFNSKALFVLVACALWQWRSLPLLATGFLAPNLLAIGWMWFRGSVADYYREVWQWGSIYAAHTFVKDPVSEGLLRTANWLGFHIAIATGAGIWFLRDRLDRDRWRFALWFALAFIGVVLGLRFFPRYYFLLLPVAALAAARGWTRFGRTLAGMAVLALMLAIPLIRFGPRYVLQARDAIMGRQSNWSDIRMDQDSRAVSARLLALAHPGDTLFVWGFRPDIFIDTRMPAGTRFLESQALSGVLADRHLFDSESIAPEFTRPNRQELVRMYPTYIVDGLGIYNPALALAAQPDLKDWLSRYEQIGRIGLCIVYRRAAS